MDWDLVIIDEAHKCSARTQGYDLRRTGRYKLAKELSRISERILLLTATPHQGNVDQFHNFLRLLDPEQFISDELNVPPEVAPAAALSKLNPQMLSLDDSPWFLRRIKEELRDFEGRKLFKQRYPITVPFQLSGQELDLYDQVTKYINRYLGKTKGLGPADPETGKSSVRRIEVKGRAQLHQKVSLTVNEWRKAQQLGDSYWLYVVWGCKTVNPQLLTIQNPVKKLMGNAKEIKQVTRCVVGAEALVRNSY